MKSNIYMCDRDTPLRSPDLILVVLLVFPAKNIQNLMWFIVSLA